MYQTIKGIYKDGRIRSLEAIPVKKDVEVTITFLIEDQELEDIGRLKSEKDYVGGMMKMQISPLGSSGYPLNIFLADDKNSHDGFYQGSRGSSEESKKSSNSTFKCRFLAFRCDKNCQGFHSRALQTSIWLNSPLAYFRNNRSCLSNEKPFRRISLRYAERSNLASCTN